MCPVTSVVPTRLADDEYLIRGKDFQEAGLRSESIVRCDLVFAIDHSRIVRRLGNVPHGTMRKILEIVLLNFQEKTNA